MCFYFIAAFTYEIYLTTKISRFTVFGIGGPITQKQSYVQYGWFCHGQSHNMAHAFIHTCSVVRLSTAGTVLRIHT